MRLSDNRLAEIASELASKPKHEKVRALLYELLTAGLGAASTDIELEKAVPEAKGRIDGLLGRTVFEIKSDLARELADAEHRLPDYIEEREKATGQRYVGIATDGFDWRVYELRAGKLSFLRSFRTDLKNPRTLLILIDPACGSGTFLFHAVRVHLAAAAKAKSDPKQRAQAACALIAGVDIHPVAIIIARVTFLLALGDALTTRSGGITIPVYPGDSLQLNVRGMFISEELVVIVPPKAGEGEQKDLHFPKSVCEFPELFDDVLETMRIASENNMRPNGFEERIKKVVAARSRVIPDFDLSVLRQTYEKIDALRRDKRDTIWSYVARNLSRPLYQSSAEHRADVVVGNPPWLAFRYMSKEFQKRFKEVAEGERVYVGGKLATQADLSALFFAKSVALYLREGGVIGFVMPLAALTRGQFEKFRTGAFYTEKVQFTEAWTFDEDVQPLFPVPSCVLFAAAGRGLTTGAEAEKIAANLDIPDDLHFQTARRRVREALAKVGTAKRIDALVAKLLDG